MVPAKSPANRSRSATSKKASPKKTTTPTGSSAAAAGTRSAPASKAVKASGRAQTLSSKTVYKGNVFWVTRDEVTEPGGFTARRDVVRHNGSVVILAVDTSTDPRDPGILLIRQYRHAAGKFLLELPAGRIEPGEKLIPAARRELIEETGYRARRWSTHVTYFASPGFLSEAMNILLAEDLTLGDAEPEEDEKIEVHMTPLSEVMRLIHAGKIQDGKTLIGVLYFHAFWQAGRL
jgi:ADP-ribose pyrophosphatase